MTRSEIELLIRWWDCSVLIFSGEKSYVIFSGYDYFYVCFSEMYNAMKVTIISFCLVKPPVQSVHGECVWKKPYVSTVTVIVWIYKL